MDPSNTQCFSFKFFPLVYCFTILKVNAHDSMHLVSLLMKLNLMNSTPQYGYNTFYPISIKQALFSVLVISTFALVNIVAVMAFGI